MINAQLAVAKAIQSAMHDHHAPWEKLARDHQDNYLRIAAAAIAALSGSPQVEAGTVRPLQWVYPTGATADEMQAAFQRTLLYQQGDAVLVWVNEGDLHMHSDPWFSALTRPREQERGEAPVAWVIPGDDNAKDDGFLDAMAWEHGEFSRPLYARAQDFRVRALAHPPLPADGWNYEEPKEDGWYWVWTKSPPQSHPAQAARFRAGDWLSNWDVIAWRLLPTPPASTEGGADA